jgi:hypothetical protein
MTNDCDRDDERNENESRGGVGEARPKRDQDGRNPERKDQCQEVGQGMSVTPDTVHGDLVSIG